ncbi:heavy metal-binding domain-containing protein [Radiobacillus kanasensis]|uniref:heavy metal-binding domain-containing protein n=1 Tax=Radiobacillus kanasensis TaxID=2844358 RepID=UPI001E34927A|nr:heavy metal-binding domain-containing protein [Radiobacillus kanasensis]UFT98617.1 heavy metal-binding domain-containing protein [Radiobacillus kanasensis]
MIVITGEQVPGYSVKEIKGPAFGLTVRARGLGKDITAAFKGLVGGEVRQYVEMLEDARKEAMDRMIENAQQMGADAIIMFRFDSGSISQNMSEIVAYGTAVTLEKTDV